MTNLSVLVKYFQHKVSGRSFKNYACSAGQLWQTVLWPKCGAAHITGKFLDLLDLSLARLILLCFVSGHIFRNPKLMSFKLLDKVTGFKLVQILEGFSTLHCRISENSRSFLPLYWSFEPNICPRLHPVGFKNIWLLHFSQNKIPS